MTTPRRTAALASLAAATTAVALLLPVGPLASAGTVPRPASNATGTQATGPDAPAPPTLQVSTVLDGLTHPWDVAFVGRHMLFTERDAERLSVRLPNGQVNTLLDAPESMWHAGETGLMGLAVDPDFADNRYVYTCHGYDNGSTRDIRVVRWHVADDWSEAHGAGNVVTGIQIVSGRHGGCRLRFAPNGALFIGTGDAAVGTNPQDLASLNGKTLRVDSAGQPWPGNPFIDEPNANTQKIFTYGHRNVQGLALRKGNEMWSAEHGTSRDDEVNKLKAGGNYGWNPVPGYDESKPMTDHSLPGKQIDARWDSGTPTIATSGMAFLQGKRWGDWRGRLAVGCLAGTELRLLQLDDRGQLVGQLSVPELDGDFGRLRAVQMGPRNALYVTTSNGGGNDRILKIKAT